MKIKQKGNDARREGQSIVEYIILMATIIALLVVFFRPGGPFTQAYDQTIQQQGFDMLNAARTVF